jgi:glucosamine-6-phosphate deaminase
VLIFSPHTDDDVICMAGTMERLVEQGHEVHVAYMVSGYLSVFDHDVSRYADFVREFNKIFGLTPDQTAVIESHIDKFLVNKKPGDVDTKEVQDIKALIRRTEAVTAAKYCGIAEQNCHFLDMPFYNTGKVQKLSISKVDIDAVLKLLLKLKPNVVFAAGDMSDPHGTHRLCYDAAFAAGDQYEKLGNERPEVWLYRGAWQEWSPDQVDMAVPLSPDEQRHKRYAIFRHQSQKDRAMFPGAYDSREFWQRAEERNMGTAKLYDQLGLPEYSALEAFARWPVKFSAHASSQLSHDKEKVKQ